MNNNLGTGINELVNGSTNDNQALLNEREKLAFSLNDDPTGEKLKRFNELNAILYPEPKTAGQKAQEFYNKEFFKQANGDKNAFINHNLLRFGIPKGSSRQKETEYYGKIFDDLSSR